MPIVKRGPNDTNSMNVSTQVSNPIEAKNDTEIEDSASDFRDLESKSKGLQRFKIRNRSAKDFAQKRQEDWEFGNPFGCYYETDEENEEDEEYCEGFGFDSDTAFMYNKEKRAKERRTGINERAREACRKEKREEWKKKCAKVECASVKCGICKCGK